MPWLDQMKGTHLVLVPGFSAFELLSSIDYFEGVSRALRGSFDESSGPRPCLHLIEGLRPAPLEARSRHLRRWLARQLNHGVIRSDELVHLIGHSSGGLTIRRMILELDDRSDELLDGSLPEVRGAALLERLGSVQFLATPHRGTNLARWAGELQALPHVALLVSRMILGALSPLLALEGERRGERRPRRTTPDMIDALHETLRNGWRPNRRWGDGSIQTMLRWLEETIEGSGELRDIDPEATAGDGLSPVHLDEAAAARELELYQRWPTRSLVTRASPRDNDPLDLYSVLDEIIRYDPSPHLGEPAMVSRLRDPEVQRRVDATDHDGVVNSTSMIWPDAERSVLVEADHADVIGHFDRGPDHFDLLRSAAPFDAHAFVELWQSLADFAQDR